MTAQSAYCIKADIQRFFARKVGIVSLAMTQAQIQQKEVYLFDRLDNPKREQLAHLKAICFLRPDPANIELLEKELRKPRYSEYHLCTHLQLPCSEADPS